MTIVVGSAVTIALILIFASHRKKAAPALHSTPQNSKKIESHQIDPFTPSSDLSAELNKKLLTKSSLLKILHLVNEKLRQDFKPIKEQNRHERRKLKKSSQETYQEFLKSSISDELKFTEQVLEGVLTESQINKEKFNEALKLYQEDDEVIGCINSSEFEASRGLLPKLEICEEVLNFELEYWNEKSSNNITTQAKLENKYILEDEVLEKWGAEIGDVHLLAKNSKENRKKLFGLYNKVREICP
mmetsp:Transcript_11589/g.11646  ORF Transcript_11589/g.11646 Transcript_11589/m.11646 type:complete len:244 (+) Transcript_11589:63-794(+)